MPRIRSEAACSTCQRRKVRCDEKLPVCGNCLKAKRYCDHTRDTRYRHHTVSQQRQPGEHVPNALPPHEALKDATTARLFAHYVSHLAGRYFRSILPGDIGVSWIKLMRFTSAWYDLSDGAMHFTKRIPQAALSRPLLFNAIIAFAAIHLSTTTTPSLRSTAER